MSVFDSPQFQVYWRIERDEGVWRLEEPDVAAEAADAAHYQVHKDDPDEWGEPEPEPAVPKPKPKVRRRIAVPPATSKPKVRPAPPSVRRSS